jgi:hypothetical protein
MLVAVADAEIQTRQAGWMGTITDGQGREYVHVDG